MAAYNLPPLTYEDQLAQLEARGMRIGRRKAAGNILATIGYTRLSSYWKHRLEGETDDFIAGTTFEQVYERYQFDSRLRQDTLYAINHIEIALRSAIVYEVSHTLGTGMWIADFALFKDPTVQAAFIRKCVSYLKDSNESWARTYKRKYNAQPAVPPAWIALQFASLGDLVNLYRDLHRTDVRRKIARRFGVNHEVLLSWLQSLHKLRNACAHHARIWNVNLLSPPVWPRSAAVRRGGWVSSWEPPVAIETSDFSQHRNLGTAANQGLTLYAACCCMKYLLDRINPHHTLRDRIKRSIEAHTSLGHAVDVEAGFPRDWLAQPLWAAHVH